MKTFEEMFNRNSLVKAIINATLQLETDSDNVYERSYIVSTMVSASAGQDVCRDFIELVYTHDELIFLGFVYNEEDKQFEGEFFDFIDKEFSDVVNLIRTNIDIPDGFSIHITFNENDGSIDLMMINESAPIHKLTKHNGEVE